jgi:pyrroline-5-carboxylate reductase
VVTVRRSTAMGQLELLVVGGGNMGEALLGGLLSRGRSGLGVVEQSPERREVLSTLFPERVTVLEVPAACAGAVVAVKPQHVEQACRELAGVGCPRVLSIAAGVTIASLEGWLGEEVAVVRAMPNTPAQVGAGAAAVAPGSRAGADDLAWAEEVLGAVGTVVRVDEGALDAVTGLSGSGPAYVFAVTESLTKAGVAAGLDPGIAAALARQTVVGAGRLLEESHRSPAELREAVTSPGGTTAAGLAVMKEKGLDAVLKAVVAAATARSKELGSA